MKKKSTSRAIGVIPARFGSSRLPGKPLIDFGGKPMIQHVFERAKKASSLDDLVIATDDERIVQAARQFGATAHLTDRAIPSGSDRIAAIAPLLGGDIYVNIQGDEPLLSPGMIDAIVQLLKDDPTVPVSTLAKQISDADELMNPGIVKVVIDQNNFALYFSRSPIPFVRDSVDKMDWVKTGQFYKHIGLYGYRADFLKRYQHLGESRLEQSERLEQLRILEHGYKIKVGVTQEDSIPVDTPDDVEKVRALMRL